MDIYTGRLCSTDGSFDWTYVDNSVNIAIGYGHDPEPCPWCGNESGLKDSKGGCISCGGFGDSKHNR